MPSKVQILAGPPSFAQRNDIQTKTLDMIYILTILISFISSILGSVVGGGGLISIPALIAIGVPAKSAIATNIFGAIAFNLVGLYRFQIAGKVHYKVGLTSAAFAMMGAVVGSRLLLLIPDVIVERILGIFILCILCVMLFNGKAGLETKKIRGKLSNWLGYFLVFILGITHTITGGGTAILLTYILVFLFGLTFLESAATRKIVFLAMSIPATAVFALNGIIDIPFGLTFMIGGALGTYVGIKYALKLGDVWIRRIFLGVVILSSIQLLL